MCCKTSPKRFTAATERSWACECSLDDGYVDMAAVVGTALPGSGGPEQAKRCTTAAPSSEPKTHAPSAALTAQPTARPTSGPTLRPTIHPCASGDHNCDKKSGGVCEELGSAWKCTCRSGFVCTNACAVDDTSIDDCAKACRCGAATTGKWNVISDTCAACLGNYELGSGQLKDAREAYCTPPVGSVDVTPHTCKPETASDRAEAAPGLVGG